MNIYQKSCFAITLLGCIITAVIAFSFWNAPYSNIFITEVAAIICAEVFLGTAVFIYSNKKDSTMVHTAGYWIVPFLYLLFTLILSLVACCNITFKKFLAIHLAGFIAALIFMISYYSSEHYIDEQSESDDNICKLKKLLRNKMQEIAVISADTFSADKDVISETNKLLEAVRFLRDPDVSNADAFEQINALLDELSFAAHSKDIDLFRTKLGDLKNKIRIYENKA